VTPHDVTITVGQTRIHGWTGYEIECDMLTPADGFSLSLAPATREVWDLCAPDREVQVAIDGTPMLRGFIGERERTVSRDGATMTVAGMDKAGRLIQESMDLVSFRDMRIGDVVEWCVRPWFDRVAFSNARNRDLVRGRRASKARATSEPLIADAQRAPKKVEPGETRWDVMAQLLEGTDLLLWSSADGAEFVVGRPNYDQETQHRFFCAAPRSGRQSEANVVRGAIKENIEERYSQVVVVGASVGDGYSYGRAVTMHRGEAVNGPGIQGVGADFERPKMLLLSDDAVRNPVDAKERAEQEMARRDAGGHIVELTVRGHAQRRLTTGGPALYAFDTIAEFEDEELGLRGRYLITRVRFRESRTEGQVTDLSMVPVGTRLTL